MPKGPQHRQILTHLNSNSKGLSQLEALMLFRVTNLSSRVCELVKRGYKITRTMLKDRDGRRYVRYRIKR